MFSYILYIYRERATDTERDTDISLMIVGLRFFLMWKRLLGPIEAALMTSSLRRPHCHFQRERVIEISPVKKLSVWAFQGTGLHVHAN